MIHTKFGGIEYTPFAMARWAASRCPRPKAGKMSYTNFDLVEVRSLKPGQGAIHARRAIAKDELLGNFDGKVTVIDLNNKDQLDEDWWRKTVHLKLEGSILYCLMPMWGPEGIDFLTHSDAPNTRVDQQIYVYADRDIEAGEEITADFATFKLVEEDT
jgi:uncharacterized protein